MAGTAFSYGHYPLNLGHRGAPKAAPENTMSAFEQARRMGADGVELDAALSADGEVVVMHDWDLQRTTTGRGRVCDLTLEQLKALDAGSHFGPQFAGERIPTLQEVVAWAQDRMLLNIELKTLSVRDSGLEQKVVDIVRQSGLEGRVILSSFNPLALRRAKQIAPHIQTGLLYAGDLPLYLRRAWLRPLARPDALHPRYTMVTDAYLLWARRKGYHVNVWTPDSVLDLQRLIDQRVDAIITNRPDVLADLLKR